MDQGWCEKWLNNTLAVVSQLKGNILAEIVNGLDVVEIILNKIFITLSIR